MKLLMKLSVLALGGYVIYATCSWMVKTIAMLPFEDTTKYVGLFLGTVLALMVADYTNDRRNNLERLLGMVMLLAGLILVATYINSTTAKVAAIVVVVVNLLADVARQDVREKIWDWLFPIPGTEDIPISHI